MPNKVEELLANLKGQLRSSLTKDSSADDIKKVESYEKQIDEIVSEHGKVVKEKEEVTQLYIEASKKDIGSKDEPEDPAKEPVTSLEDIAQELMEKESQDKK